MPPYPPPYVFVRVQRVVCGLFGVLVCRDRQRAVHARVLGRVPFVTTPTSADVAAKVQVHTHAYRGSSVVRRAKQSVLGQCAIVERRELRPSPAKNPGRRG